MFLRLDSPIRFRGCRRRLVRTAVIALVTLIVLTLAAPAHAQRSSYTSWRTGSSSDATGITPTAGYVLAGGGSDVNSAMRWFKDAANGGDIVILRASGSDGYNNYLYNNSPLGGTRPNSVHTIRFNRAAAASNSFVLDTLRNAEAIFFAGGDQSDYVNYWRGTEVETIINEKAAAGVPIGGLSAGLAILGSSAYGALNNSITSSTAMNNPFNNNVTMVHDFLQLPGLENTITDSHFTNRDRHGRLITFMARTLLDTGADRVRGIGIDDNTALVVDGDGMATVHATNSGGGDVYVFQSNGMPEVLTPGQPLTFTGISVTRFSRGMTFDLATLDHPDAERFTYDVINGQLFRDDRVVPEPGTLSLLLGAAAVAFRRPGRRRRA
jgi:cyanophycinase